MQFDNPQAVEKILERNAGNHMYNHFGVKKYYIKNLVKAGLTVAPHVAVESVLSYMKKNDGVVGICVLEQDQVVGVITREKLFKKLSGQYGFSLYRKKSIGELAETSFLMVDARTSISSVAKIAMEREMDTLYDFIVVKEEDRARQYITACNRHGVTEQFPLVSVTIVSTSNEREPFGNHEEVVEMLAGYKKAEKSKKRQFAAV